MMLEKDATNRRRLLVSALGAPMILGLPAPAAAAERPEFVQVEVRESAWRSFLEAARTLDDIERARKGEP